MQPTRFRYIAVGLAMPLGAASGCEPATRTYHITGTACGREIDVRMSLPTP